MQTSPSYWHSGVKSFSVFFFHFWCFFFFSSIHLAELIKASIYSRLRKLSNNFAFLFDYVIQNFCINEFRNLHKKTTISILNINWSQSIRFEFDKFEYCKYNVALNTEFCMKLDAMNLCNCKHKHINSIDCRLFPFAKWMCLTFR